MTLYGTPVGEIPPDYTGVVWNGETVSGWVVLGAGLLTGAALLGVGYAVGANK